MYTGTSFSGSGRPDRKSGYEGSNPSVSKALLPRRLAGSGHRTLSPVTRVRILPGHLF